MHELLLLLLYSNWDIARDLLQSSDHNPRTTGIIENLYSQRKHDRQQWALQTKSNQTASSIDKKRSKIRAWHMLGKEKSKYSGQ